MAIDPQKRQRKLAKEAAKRKEKREKTIDRMADFLSLSSGKLPLHESLMTKNLFEHGMGNVFISRKRSDGHFPTSVFLIRGLGQFVDRM